MKWDYGDAGDRIPIKTGDIWRVDHHIFACGDLELRHDEALLNKHVVSPQMTYVDPPWTPSLLTGFRTKAGLPRGKPFSDFLDNLIRAISPTSGDCYIEMGKQHVDSLRQKVEDSGGVIEADFPITYYKKNPARLLRVSFGYPRNASFAFDNMDDADTPAKAVRESTVPMEWVFDPCTGKGLTAVAAATQGRRFIGMELNPRRMAVAIDAVSRLVGKKPEKVGTL